MGIYEQQDNQSSQGGEGGSEAGSGTCLLDSSGVPLRAASSFKARTEKEASEIKMEFQCFSVRSLTM